MTISRIKSLLPHLLWIPVILFLVRCSLGEGDFKVFLEASKLVLQGKNPYHLWIYISEGNYAWFYYSPLWATLLIPLSFLPNFIPNFLWLSLNVWFLVRIWTLLSRYVDLPAKLTKTQMNLLILLVALQSARFILYNFEMIQMTIFLLWGSLESLSLFKRNKNLGGAALLALVINIKLLPLVLIPYLLYRGRFKAVGFTLVFSILFLALPGLVVGWETNTLLLSEWWSVINPGNREHLLETDLGLHSLTALIPTLLSQTQGVLPFTRNICDLDPATTTWILNGARMALVLLTVVFLGWPPFRPARSRLHELREISYLFLIIPLIFPHQQKYAFFLAAPALFYLSCFIVVNFKAGTRSVSSGKYYTILALSVLSFVLMTLTTDSVIGRQLNQITQHYKLITYGTLLLVLNLALCPPADLKHKGGTVTTDDR